MKGALVRSVELKSSSKEYQDVERQFQATCKLKIEKVNFDRGNELCSLKVQSVKFLGAAGDLC